MTGLKTYVVGGAVRDALLGLPVKDRDYVVVGATPEQMQALGFVPVGKDFPVFLHPQTHEEYALARTERKTAPGYTGFAFHAAADVSLEQDLQRRDLTINAIAQAEDGTLTDPYSGRADIDARVFRHVSPAFTEDPVRILRVARFAARFTEFSIATETMGLMRQMVSAGEVDALVAERVWQELSRGLSEAAPSRMFDVLRECGALARVFPELDALVGLSLQASPLQPKQELKQEPKQEPKQQQDSAVEALVTHRTEPVDCFAHALQAVDHAARQNASLAIRFAVLLPAIGHAPIASSDLSADLAADARAAVLVERLCKRLRVPHEVRDLAVVVVREQAVVARAEAASAAAMVRLFERCDAFRKPARFAALLDACQCVHATRTNQNFPQKPLLQCALSAAQSVDAGAIAAAVTGSAGEHATDKIPDVIHAARVQAVAHAVHAGGAASA